MGLLTRGDLLKKEELLKEKVALSTRVIKEAVKKVKNNVIFSTGKK